MKNNLDKRVNKTSITMKIPVLVLILGILFLNGCGTGEADNESAAPAETTITSQGQEVASSINSNEAFATLPPPIIVEASDTPIPATDTPQATPTQESTSTPEETEVPATETFTPVPPTNTAQPVQPTSPPPPTETPEPLPTAPPPKGVNGLVASHFALQDRSDYHAGGSVWFEFTIANDTGNEVPYNALGVMPKKDGIDRFEWYQQTYGGKNSTISAGGFSWEDRIKLPEAGNYTLRLVMCFDGYDNCLQGGGTWQTMSDEIAVQIN
ncbi:MAG: hypothetical protein ACK2T1_09460 [Candidatus Promineifilaceae bacterium]|jgi:hypothetical protein